MPKQILLTRGHANTKTAKTKDRVEMAILHLSPYKMSGKNLCPMANKSNVHTAVNELKTRNATVIVTGIHKEEAVPDTWWGHPTIDGDKYDTRFEDPTSGHMVILRAKGKAVKSPHVSEEEFNLMLQGKEANKLYCHVICLNESGRGALPTAQQARLKKTEFLNKDPNGFIDQMLRETENLMNRAEKRKLRAALRPNGTSDYLWERKAPQLFTNFPELMVYDYTKIPNRNVPSNYHLTFSINNIWNVNQSHYSLVG